MAATARPRQCCARVEAPSSLRVVHLDPDAAQHLAEPVRLAVVALPPRLPASAEQVFNTHHVEGGAVALWPFDPAIGVLRPAAAPPLHAAASVLNPLLPGRLRNYVLLSGAGQLIKIDEAIN